MTTEFTPLLSLVGGALIGLSALILMATTGRIAGVSGIVSRLLPPVADKSSLAQGLMFIAGLLMAVPLHKLVTGSVPVSDISSNLPLLVVGGLLVGFGSALGGGCTSGHGVCGISRLSPRSIVATLVFMVTAFGTVYVLRHMIGGLS
jgi:uncharacterized membrane protein YedE/YeeE